MGKQTINQRDEQIRKEGERLRLLGKSREILKIMEEETANDAVTIFTYLLNLVKDKSSEMAKQNKVKEVCPNEEG